MPALNEAIFEDTGQVTGHASGQAGLPAGWDALILHELSEVANYLKHERVI